MKRAWASTPRTPLCGGQGPGGAHPSLTPRAHPPACAQHLPARGDRARPARSRLPSGTQLPKTPGAADVSEPDSRTRSARSRVRTRDAHFPRATSGAGRARGGAAPWRARAKLQHKRPMSGSARRPGQAPPPLPGSEPPPAARAGRRPRSPPGPGMRTPARPGAHAAAAARAGDAPPAAGLCS